MARTKAGVRRRRGEYRKQMAKVRRGIRSGRFASSCDTFTRKYCFDKKGHKTAACTPRNSYRAHSRAISRCRDRHNGRFTVGRFCGPSSRCSKK